MATRNSTVANNTVSRTYRSAVSRAAVPASKATSACSFKVAASSVSALWYSGMKIGPAGASGLVNGWVFSHASNATRYSSLNRRT
jgi:hypothetical protein